jgi:hypothetical protein
MINKLKSILLAIPLIIGLTSCATKIHGSLDVSYVPKRVNETEYENELRTEIDTHASIPLGKCGLDIGGTQTTYMNILENANILGLFEPTNQNYEFYTKFKIPIKFGTIEAYAYHNCFHPINREYIIRSFPKIYSQRETMFGVKVEF